MRKAFPQMLVLLLVAIPLARGFVPPVSVGRSPLSSSVVWLSNKKEPNAMMEQRPAANTPFSSAEQRQIAGLVVYTPILATLLTALPADAAQSGLFPVLAALTAYLHYAGMLSAVGCLVAERLLLQKTNFNEDDEDLLTKIDIVYGLVGIPIFVSGYFRVTQYGKGFDFYKHEPFFWLKIALAGVLAGSSFFPTGTIIKRAAAKKDSGIYEPLSDKLQQRLQSVVNAELTGIAFIPLTATLMARGVGYSEDFPWQIEAGLAALVFAGASAKYVLEVLNWSDEPDDERAMEGY